MIRFLFRLLAMVALAVAVVMSVLDATRSTIASQVVLTPLGTSWLSASPETLASAEATIRRYLPAFAWEQVAVTILAAPGFVVFLCLALLFHAIGRQPARRIGRFAAEN